MSQIGFMGQDATSAELFDLISEIQIEDGVCFDPDNLTLHGLYSDELSAHRAKRGWVATFEANFFLEPDLDYSLNVDADPARGKYVLTSTFTSASGRYAFWKITHRQAPEAQYLIETAHVPNSESHHDEFLKSKDLEPVRSAIERQLDQIDFATGQETISLLDKIVNKLKQLVR